LCSWGAQRLHKFEVVWGFQKFFGLKCSEELVSAPSLTRKENFHAQTSALAALALAAATFGVAVGGPAESAPSSRDTAIEALAKHPVLARAADGQSFKTVSTLVDRDGTTHVRLNRTFHGLPVVGGDLVVHQTASGAWKGVSQTLRAPLDLAVVAKVTDAVASRVALRPSAVNALVKGETLKAAPALVVDATRATPRLAWRVMTRGVQRDGTPSRLATYVDGDGVNYGPLVSLDVAGHEMSHGVTENSANLTYSGESGGLNESTSDIFGSLVEAYANNTNDPADYLIGEEFDLKNHVGFRRMDKPSSDGSSKDCWYSGVGNLDVHYSSGVGNHFFYLLAEGSGAKLIGGVQHNSPTCNGSTVTGITAAKAGKIWYRALTVYMTSSTNYAGARAASIKAAQDLYPGGTEAASVAAAWSAVSVN